MRGRLTAIAAMCVMLAVPAIAHADDWPRRLFPIARASDPQFDAVQDFLEQPGGALLIASGSEDSSGGRVRELGVDGRLRTVVRFERAGGRSGIGLLGDRGSRFLAIDGWGDRVVRVRASGKTERFAGTGTTGFSGDGGPATAARLRFGASGFVGLARTADGSVVFPDAWNNRVRRVRPDGVIETIAGIGPPVTGSSTCAFSGDGGPATKAGVCDPTDVLATPDGGLVVSTFDRLRRIAPDGTITTIAGRPAPLFLPMGLAQLPDGDILFAEADQIRRLAPDGRVESFLRFSGAGDDMRDFTGRQIFYRPTGIVRTAEGGLLIAAGDAYYLAPRHSRRKLVGIRGARVRRGSVALDVQLTRRARATVAVSQDGRTVARRTRTIGGGKRTLTVHGPFTARPYAVRLSLPGAGARDGVTLYLGTWLRKPFMKRFSEGFEEDGFPERCRSFTSRRVDCVLNFEGDCESVASYTLRRTGVIWRRAYGCTDLAHPFRRHPKYTESARPLRL
jgi:hypothetical protein